MKLVTFLKSWHTHSANAGEEHGLPDDLADNLIKRGIVRGKVNPGDDGPSGDDAPVREAVVAPVAPVAEQEAEPVEPSEPEASAADDDNVIEHTERAEHYRFGRPRGRPRK